RAVVGFVAGPPDELDVAALLQQDVGGDGVVAPGEVAEQRERLGGPPGPEERRLLPPLPADLSRAAASARGHLERALMVRQVLRFPPGLVGVEVVAVGQRQTAL